MHKYKIHACGSGGFYINSDSLPVGSEWVRYLSLMYWGFQVQIIHTTIPMMQRVHSVLSEHGYTYRHAVLT